MGGSLQHGNAINQGSPTPQKPSCQTFASISLLASDILFFLNKVKGITIQIAYVIDVLVNITMQKNLFRKLVEM